MATQAQMAANQANAQHSCGPTSKAGKARSCLNRTAHGLAGENVLLPGEDPKAFDRLKFNLIGDHAPATAAERFLVQTIAESQWRLDRIAAWETLLIEESLTGDPAEPSRLMKMFSKSGDSSEALAKLHRYEGQVRRTYMNALKEMRMQKSARHRAETVEAATKVHDQNKLVALARRVAGEMGIAFPGDEPVDDSNPIPAAPVTEPIVGDPDLPAEPVN